MTEFKIKNQYSASVPSSGHMTYCPSKAVQSQKEEADVNNIISRFVKDGVLPISTRRPEAMDCPDIDFMQAQIKILEAKAGFYELPAKVRKEFKTPENFIKFVMDPNTTREDLDKYGLLKESGSEPVSSVSSNSGGISSVDSGTSTSLETKSAQLPT